MRFFLALFLVIFLLPVPAFADPPKYDLIFAMYDYQGDTIHDQLSVQFVVKDGVLRAQYARKPPNAEAYWKKLFRYDAGTKKVHELTFELPPDAGKIDKMTEETVEATAGLKLDTATISPDGYSLNSQRTRSGNFSACYRCTYIDAFLSKNGVSLKLLADNGANFPGTLEFIGWVIPGKTPGIPAPNSP